MPPSKSSRKTAQELADTNVRYYGHNRLMEMDHAELMKLSSLMSGDDGEPRKELDSTSKASVVEYILERKKLRENKPVSQSPLSESATSKIIQSRSTNASKEGCSSSSSEKGAADVPVLVDGDKNTSDESDFEKVEHADSSVVDQSGEPANMVVKDKHRVKIVAFNSLKLRISRQGLEAQWTELIKLFATMDVVMVTEVPAERAVEDMRCTRAFGMKRLLDLFTYESTGGKDEEEIPEAWDMVISKPSGPGPSEEVHAVFVRRPIEILKCTTNYNANGVSLDHAPFCVVIRDDRFAHEENRTWALTSVHFPPKSRSKDRDAQLEAFFGKYCESSEFRADTPFTRKGAKDAQTNVVNHIICGDFNVYPDAENYGLEKKGFAPPLLGDGISTSAGGFSYDNFVVSKETLRKFSMSGEVLELTIPHKPNEGKTGVSDHSPITVCIKEQPIIAHKKSS